MSLRIIKSLILLLVFMLLGSCGQKGSLYLPGEKQSAVVSYLNVG